jgi:hypothetical protein
LIIIPVDGNICTLAAILQQRNVIIKRGITLVHLLDSETRKTEIKKKTPNVAVGGVLRENITEIERKLRDLGIQVAPCILEARHRRKQHTENVAERAQKSRHIVHFTPNHVFGSLTESICTRLRYLLVYYFY